MADADCSRMARTGRSMPAMSTMVSTRASPSRGELACSVESEPSWPVFIAWSMSSASAPRTSPTTMRSGRMRSVLRRRSRARTSPLPSMLDGRLSSRITWRCCSRSSAASSMVTMRSVGGIIDDSTLSSVVLPLPVPPLMRMFMRPCTHAARKSATWPVSVPSSMRSCSVSTRAANLRMVSCGSVDGERRDHRVHARAVGETGVDHR